MRNSFSSVLSAGSASRNRKSSTTATKHALRIESLEERALLDAVPLVSNGTDEDQNTAIFQTVETIQAEKAVADAKDLEIVQQSITAAGLMDTPETSAITNPAIAGVIESETGTYYILDFAVEGTTQRVFVAGVAAEDISNVVTKMTAHVLSGSTSAMNITGDFVDADKYSTSVSNMCWAGAVSNALWYTGWANDSTALGDSGTSMFTSEDSVLRHYGANFTNQGDETFYSGEWFIDGRFRPQSWASWTDTTLVEGSTGGGFYSDDYNLLLRTASGNPTFIANGKTIEVQESLTGGNFTNLLDMRTQLEAGSGATFHISWNGGGHLISGWGYVYDTAYETTDPNYYKSVLITDPDDNRYSGSSAPNNLKCVSLEYKNSALYMLDYGYGTGKGTTTSGNTYILNFTALTKYESSVDLAARNTSVLSSDSVDAGASVTLRNIYVNNAGGENSHVYTINIYASIDGTITSSDILLDSFTTSDLSAGRNAVLSRTFSTENLAFGSTYTIGYIIESTLDTNETNNTGVAATTLTIGPKTLDAPAILKTDIAKTSVSVRIRSVSNASNYVLEYSTDATFSNPALIVSNTYDSDGIYVLEDLKGETTYYFRCKAVGDGTYYNDSPYSSILTVTTLPYTYDLECNTDVELSSNVVAIGESVTVKGIEIKNNGDTWSGDYTLCLYASTNSSISTSDILLDSYEMKSLAAGAVETISPTLCTDLLDTNRSYYIGWMIVSEKDKTSSNDKGHSKGMLRVTQIALGNPTLEIEAVTSTTISVNIGGVENSAAYVVQYSETESFAKISTLRFTQDGSQTITGLKPSTAYYFRCYAVRSGAYLNSGYSDVVSAETNRLGLSPSLHASGNSVTVQWNRLSGVTSYILYTRVTGTGTWKETVVYDSKSTFQGVAGCSYDVRVSDYDRTDFSETMEVTLLQKPILGNADSTSTSVSGTITNYSQTNLTESDICTVTITQIGTVTANYSAILTLENGSGSAAFVGTGITATLQNGVLTLNGLRNTTSYTFVATFSTLNDEGQEISCSAISTSLKTTTQAAEPGEVSSGITVLETTAQTMTVQWDPILLPGNGYIPTFYTVRYRKADSTRWTTSTTKASASTPYTITRLAADTEYEIQVTATPVRRKTVSTEILSVMETTNIQLPTPRMVKDFANSYDFGIAIENFDSTKLSQSTHMTVTIVKIGNVTKNLSTTFALDGGTGTFTGIDAVCTFENGTLVFTNAAANTTYNITTSFLIVNNGETSASSNTSKVVKITTQKSPYDTPICNVHGVSVNSAEVAWNAVYGENSTRLASSYTVQYRVSGTEAWKTASSAVKTTSYTITKLASNTTYEIRVFANKSTAFAQSEASMTACTTWAQIAKPKVTLINQGSNVLVNPNASLRADKIGGVQFKLTLNGKYSTDTETKAFKTNIEWDASVPYDFTYGTLTFNKSTGMISVALNADYVSCTMRIGFAEISGILKNGTPASWDGTVNSAYFTIR